MRNSLMNMAADIFREPSSEAAQHDAPSRLCAYIEAIGACALLVIVGGMLFAPWS